MGIDLNAALREALDLWQNPPFTELSRDAQIDAANRCIQQRWLDLNLSGYASARLKKGAVFEFAADNAAARAVVLNSMGGVSADFISPAWVEFRSTSSTSEDDWEELTVVSFETWLDIKDRGDKLFASFSNWSDEITGQMHVNFDPTNYEFRLVYHASVAETTDTTLPSRLPAPFKALLVYDIALEFGELIDNQSPEFSAKKKDKMPYLLARQQDALDRFAKWRRTNKSQGSTHRRAFNDRDGGLNVRRRRFTVDF